METPPSRGPLDSSRFLRINNRKSEQLHLFCLKSTVNGLKVDVLTLCGPLWLTDQQGALI